MVEFEITRTIRAETLARIFKQFTEWVAQREDWQDSAAMVAIKGETLTLTADTEQQLQTMLQGLAVQLRVHCLPPELVVLKPCNRWQHHVTQEVRLAVGLDRSDAKALADWIAELGLPVRVKASRRQLRVSGPDRASVQKAVVQMRLHHGRGPLSVLATDRHA
jgi:uncharacterized protein YajQ (UPF0234 family)